MAFDLSPATTRTRPDCNHCPVGDCLGKAADAAARWRSLVGLHPPQLPGAAPLLTAGQPLDTLFSVRAGCIKSYTVDADGNEHVRAFYFPGDLVGLDAFGSATAPANLAAVGGAQLCGVDAATLLRQLPQDAALTRRLFDQTRRELRVAQALSGGFTADQRVAALLLHLRGRLGTPDRLRLPMTRREIGSYLRLATETVCRVLARFEGRGWVHLQDKRITLVDTTALGALAAPVGLEGTGASLALAA